MFNCGAHVHLNEGTCHPVQHVDHFCVVVFLAVFGQQLRSVVQRNTIYEALTTLSDNKVNTDHDQTYYL